MPDTELYNSNPREYALELVEEGVDYKSLLVACIKNMTHQDIRDMLDNEELSPRFFEDEENG